MEKRLPNIFKTTNATKLTKTILKSSYRVLQGTSKWKTLKHSVYFLRILTEKKHRQIKLQRLQKVGIWAFGSLVHQTNSLQEVLKQKQYFRKNKVVTRKTPFFVIGPFCTDYSIIVLILYYYFQYSHYSYLYYWLLIGQHCMEMIFVLSAKNGTPVFWKRFSFCRKSVSKLKYWKHLTFSLTFTQKYTDLSNGGRFWKSLTPFFRRTGALSVDFKIKPLRKSAFQY